MQVFRIAAVTLIAGVFMVLPVAAQTLEGAIDMHAHSDPEREAPASTGGMPGGLGTGLRSEERESVPTGSTKPRRHRGYQL